MAEIRYEERFWRAWPWVLGLLFLLLLLLLWSVALRPGRGGDIEVRDGADRLGAAETPAQPAPTAAEAPAQPPPTAAEGESEEREARDEATDEDLERMRTRMIA